MIEQPNPTSDEAENQYRAHKDLASKEEAAKREVEATGDVVISGNWSDMVRIETNKEELELAHQATEFQAKQSGEWVDRNLDKVIASAKTDAEAEGIEIHPAQPSGKVEE